MKNIIRWLNIFIILLQFVLLALRLPLYKYIDSGISQKIKAIPFGTECRLRQKDWPLQGDEIFWPGPKSISAWAKSISARAKMILVLRGAEWKFLSTPVPCNPLVWEMGPKQGGGSKPGSVFVMGPCPHVYISSFHSTPLRTKQNSPTLSRLIIWLKMEFQLEFAALDCQFNSKL